MPSDSLEVKFQAIALEGIEKLKRKEAISEDEGNKILNRPDAFILEHAALIVAGIIDMLLTKPELSGEAYSLVT
jgi:hypothetical protein